MARPIAMVTGASSGIGTVFARRLARDHDLVLVARRMDRLQTLAEELRAGCGAAVEPLQADLTDENDLRKVEERIAAEARLALLVNNAGFGTRGLFWKLPLEDHVRMHRLHIDATLRLSYAALRGMVERNAGGIVNVASVAAFVRRTGSTNYGATKCWMAAFTESLYLELKSVGSAVKVQALCPGFTQSEFHEVLQLDRKSIAPRWAWLSAERVVDDSLKGLAQGKLFVVPGWQYKAVVALLSTMPNWLRVAVSK
ncbi:MAG TPA: SDR family oxidoreductase [Terracidiphilus sp.]|nr:SDR family oxidoreductase [Terracidiphilus sp.]